MLAKQPRSHRDHRTNWKKLYKQLMEEVHYQDQVNKKLGRSGNNKDVNLMKDLRDLHSGNIFEKLPPLDTIVSLDPRADVLARVEDSLLQWLQVIGIFLATSFVIVSLVDNKKRRKWYSILFFIITTIIAITVFHQFVKFRNELKNLNIEEPLRVDVLLFTIVIGTVGIAVITFDHAFSDITK